MMEVQDAGIVVLAAFLSFQLWMDQLQLRNAPSSVKQVSQLKSYHSVVDLPNILFQTDVT